MLAKSIMNTNVVSLPPSATVKEIARTLYTQRISAVPIVDAHQQLVGIVSEGDLLYRSELGTEHRHSWWLSFFADPERRSHDYIKEHAKTAKDIMTSQVICVSGDTSVQVIADLLERHQIKRVPVLQEEKLIGIVSRVNLVQSLAVDPHDSKTQDERNTDQDIREALMSTIHNELGIQTTSVNIIVEHGVVHLWGFVDGKHEKKALQIAAENIAGVKQVDSRLIRISSLPAYGY